MANGHGGPRPNSGGKRPGAGRKRKPENMGAEHAPATPGATPLDVLLAMMNNPDVPVAQRIKAAQALLPFMHARIGEIGKKDAAAAKAKTTSAGRFASAAPPAGKVLSFSTAAGRPPATTKKE